MSARDWRAYDCMVTSMFLKEAVDALPGKLKPVNAFGELQDMAVVEYWSEARERVRDGESLSLVLIVALMRF